MIRRIIPCLAAVVATLTCTVAKADVINLTTANASDNDGQVLYNQIQPQSTGTGLIHPFLRVNSPDNTNQGFNTDAQGNDLAVPFKTMIDASQTNSLLLSSLAVATISGTDYYQFLLDINQTGANPILDMVDLRIYQGTGLSPTNFDTAGNGSFTGATTTLVYMLTAGDVVRMDFSLNHGSGSGDVLVSVPVSLFTANTPNIYLYSRFGSTTYPNNDGFEEWAAVTGEGGIITTAVPAPPALVLGVVGAIGMFGRRAWTRRKTAELAV